LDNKKNNLSELFGTPVKQDDRIFTKQLLSIHEFYLSGELQSSEHYIQWFDTIRNAGENDAIKIYINSPGGDLFTAIQFMQVLNATPATIIISVEGQCASAATMLFMCGDTFEVSEHSMFMFHTYSGGTSGKGGEMFDQIQYERIWSEKLLREVYKNFLTDDEIVSMLDSKDIWMSGDDVIDRLNMMKEQIQLQQKEANEEANEEV
jgi:ATP-dependent protease ClpP protease subunit